LTLDDGRAVAWREASRPGHASSDCAVVLLHGISSGAASWLGVALALRRLAPAARVLAWDAPGYGRSTPLHAPGDADDPNLTMRAARRHVSTVPRDAQYAQVLAQSLAVLGVRRCVLVGHSLGALMATCHARKVAPDTVLQLVLISPAGGYGAPQQARQRAVVRQQRLAALQTQGVAGLAAAIDQRLVAPATAQPLRQWLRWNTARMQTAGYVQAVELLCNSDLGRSVGRLSMPVHVWVGEHDVVTPPAACRDWARKLGAQYATIADAGHAVAVEQAQTVAQRLAGLLGGVPVPQG